jgi:tellurite resistance protein
MSLTSDVTRIAERVAAADGYVHPDEAQVIRLIRLITMSFPEPKVIEPHA